MRRDEILAPRFRNGTRRLGALSHKHIACRIACTEAADKTEVAFLQVFIELAEGDDRACRACIGIFLKNIRLLARLRLAAQYLAADKVVHTLVCLMEPHPLQLF